MPTATKFSATELLGITTCRFQMLPTRAPYSLALPIGTKQVLSMATLTTEEHQLV